MNSESTTPRDQKNQMAVLKELLDFPAVRTAIVAGLLFIAFVMGMIAWLGWGATPIISGAYGDAFGIANALFSGLAFLGVIVTIFMQSLELRDQREELRRSADALDQRLQFERQLLVTRLSLDLFGEWNGEELHQSRIYLEEHLRKNSEAGYSHLRRAAVTAFPVAYRLHRFFMKWAALARAGKTDNELLMDTLGNEVIWWWDHLLMNEGKTATELRGELEVIWRFVVKPTRQHLRIESGELPHFVKDP